MVLLNRFINDRSGNVAVIFAVAALPLAGVTGAAVDYVRATEVKHKLAAATDAAALSSVAMKASSSAERNAQAERIIRSSMPPGLDIAISTTASDTEADVTASTNVKTSLLQVLKIPSVAVSAHSKAVRNKEGSPPCVLALNKTAAPAIDLGGSAVFEGVSCVLHANSSAPGALSVSGAAKAKAGGYCAVGTVTSYYKLSPDPKNSCEPMVDTYAGLQRPADTLCKQNLTNVSVNPNQKKTLQPGVYCGGLDLKGDVTLEPGLYVVKDGQLSMNSSGTITGLGVTFYLMGSDAGFDINGGAKLELTAMTTGEYKGLLFVQDRSSNVGATSKLNGNAATLIKGAIYAPTQTVRMNGSGTFGQLSPFMPLIADKVVITGNATAKIDSTNVPLVAPLPHVLISARLTE
jgi:Putative Flp pilus-assembly TadE/G-like